MIEILHFLLHLEIETKPNLTLTAADQLFNTGAADQQSDQYSGFNLAVKLA